MSSEVPQEQRSEHCLILFGAHGRKFPGWALFRPNGTKKPPSLCLLAEDGTAHLLFGTSEFQNSYISDFLQSELRLLTSEKSIFLLKFL
jgi:hypothetical protein